MGSPCMGKVLHWQFRGMLRFCQRDVCSKFKVLHIFAYQWGKFFLGLVIFNFKVRVLFRVMVIFRVRVLFRVRAPFRVRVLFMVSIDQEVPELAAPCGYPLPLA